MTLFAIMASNDWSLADGLIAVAGTRWSALFFVLFYIVTNLICLNLVVGVLIDAFVEHWREKQHPAENFERWLQTSAAAHENDATRLSRQAM